MANEIVYFKPTGEALYAVIFDDTISAWNGTAFEALNTTHWANYAISLTEHDSAGVYSASLPSAVTLGTYQVAIYKRAGATPASNDTAVANASLRLDASGSSSGTAGMSFGYI